MAAGRKLGVIFLNKQTTKSGAEYFSGKTEGSEELNVKAYINESKNGNKYLSLIEYPAEPRNDQQGFQKSQYQKPQEQNHDDQINPDDLPF